MIVTFQDELGLVSIKIDNTYGVQFGYDRAYFTDENGKDYDIAIEHLISIADVDWYSAE